MDNTCQKVIETYDILVNCTDALAGLYLHGSRLLFFAEVFFKDRLFQICLQNSQCICSKESYNTCTDIYNIYLFFPFATDLEVYVGKGLLWRYKGFIENFPFIC